MKPFSLLAVALGVASTAAVPTAAQDHPVLDEPEIYTGSQFEQRACPHVHEADGGKRCIGSKERRDLDSGSEGLERFSYGDHGPNKRDERVTNPMEKKRMCPHKREDGGQEDCIMSKDRRDEESFEYGLQKDENRVDKRSAEPESEPAQFVTGSNPNEYGSDRKPMEEVSKRVCPHVRDVDGVKRCIGNKQKRDEETSEENESFWVGLNGYNVDKQRWDDCPTCEGKLQNRDIEQQDNSSEWGFDRPKRPKVAWFSGEERDDCSSCAGKSKCWSSGSGVVVTDRQSNAEDNQASTVVWADNIDDGICYTCDGMLEHRNSDSIALEPGQQENAEGEKRGGIRS
jgi:hypothetical protein